MILLQLSAAQGPDECCLAVSKALEQLIKEAQSMQVALELIETEAGEINGTLRSALVSLSGEASSTLSDRWCGSLLWICPSPWRPHHRRKNWFIGAARFKAPEPAFENEIRFETCRASGPGGQHVNKTDSAVRATHVASGISVKVQSERSQHANKRLAMLLIAQQLEQCRENERAAIKSQRRLFHHQVERGAPLRVFKGVRFTPA